jgi:hypothetical protein
LTCEVADADADAVTDRRDGRFRWSADVHRVPAGVLRGVQVVGYEAMTPLSASTAQLAVLAVPVDELIAARRLEVLPLGRDEFSGSVGADLGVEGVAERGMQVAAGGRSRQWGAGGDGPLRAAVRGDVPQARLRVRPV